MRLTLQVRDLVQCFCSSSTHTPQWRLGSYSGGQRGRRGRRKKSSLTLYSGTSDKGPSEIGTTSLQRTLVATPWLMYSGTSDKGPSEIGTTTLQRTLVAAPWLMYSGTSDKGPSEIGTTSLQRTLVAAPC